MRTLGHLRLLVLPLALGVAAAAVAVPAPAAASVAGSTSSEDVVLRDRCQSHDISYTLAVSPETVLWNLHITVLDPDGLTSEGADVSSASLSPTTGTVSVPFCGSEMPGTYTVRATGIWQVLPGVRIPYALPDSTFEVRRALTRTTVTDKPLGERRHRLTVAVADERPAGFRPATGAQVRLERLVDGTWRVVRGSRAMTDHGLTTIRLTARRGTRVRAVTAGSGFYAGSTSAPVRLGR